MRRIRHEPGDGEATCEPRALMGAASMEEFARKLTVPRNAWIMVPAAITDKVVGELAAHLHVR